MERRGRGEDRAANDLEKCVLWRQERIQEQIVEETAPQITEKVVEVKETITDLMNRLQITDVPATGIEPSMEVHAPHVIGEIVEVFELILQEREKNCAVKQTNDQKHAAAARQSTASSEAGSTTRERERKGRKEEGKRESNVLQRRKICLRGG